MSALFQFIITSKLLYRLFIHGSIKDDFIKLKHAYISVINRSQFVKSLLYFGLYERKEQQVITKYLNTAYTVVEFGASIGVITSLLCRLSKQDVYAVEANPLLNLNLELTKEKNNFSTLTIISAAISYSKSEFINICIDDNNLGSKLAVDGVKVPSLTLHALLSSYHINEYVLVADIEGAELELFLLESNVDTIQNCKQIIIELHDSSCDGTKYTKNDIAAIICNNFKMKCLFHYSDIWVFGR